MVGGRGDNPPNTVNEQKGITIGEIHHYLTQVDLSRFAAYARSEDKGEAEGDEPNGVMVVDRDIPLETWNNFLEGEHLYKGMLMYEDSRIWVIEAPKQPHETAAMAANSSVDPLCRTLDMKYCGANRWVGGDNIGREADASYRPFLAAAPPPAGVNKDDYVTLIIEVGYSQQLGGARGLKQKAQAWLNNYPTLQYVILISISAALRSLKAEVWEPAPAQNPTQTVNFSNPNAAPIVLNVHRLLNIAPGSPIPHGHANNINIDLNYIRTMIRD